MKYRDLARATAAGIALFVAVIVAPSGPAHADWGGCTAWVSGTVGRGKCNNVHRRWRVWADCKLADDRPSEWVEQRGGLVERHTPECPWGVRGAWVEEKSL